MTIFLRTTVTTEPDLRGYDYHLFTGEVFDPDQFCAIFDLNRDELSEADVVAAAARAAGLYGSQWMKVEYYDER